MGGVRAIGTLGQELETSGGKTLKLRSQIGKTRAMFSRLLVTADVTVGSRRRLALSVKALPLSISWVLLFGQSTGLSFERTWALQDVDHIRSSCLLNTANARKPFIVKGEFCLRAREALEDLAAGNIDKGILGERPEWREVSDPNSEAKCATQPNIMRAEACDAWNFELKHKDIPLSIIVVDQHEAEKSENTAVTAIIRGREAGMQLSEDEAAQ